MSVVCIGRPALDAKSLPIPVAGGSVSAGFPSPAADFEDQRLDANTYLIRNPVSTFYFRVEGCSMEGAQIFEGDVLVVDRSVQARYGHIVIAFVGGERLVKRLVSHHGKVMLKAEHPDYPSIEIGEGCDLMIWGVVVGKFSRVPA